MTMSKLPAVQRQAVAVGQRDAATVGGAVHERRLLAADRDVAAGRVDRADRAAGLCVGHDAGGRVDVERVTLLARRRARRRSAGLRRRRGAGAGAGGAGAGAGTGCSPPGTARLRAGLRGLRGLRVGWEEVLADLALDLAHLRATLDGLVPLRRGGGRRRGHGCRGRCGRRVGVVRRGAPLGVGDRLVDRLVVGLVREGQLVVALEDRRRCAAPPTAVIAPPPISRRLMRSARSSLSGWSKTLSDMGDIVCSSIRMGVSCSDAVSLRKGSTNLADPADILPVPRRAMLTGACRTRTARARLGRPRPRAVTSARTLTRCPRRTPRSAAQTSAMSFTGRPLTAKIVAPSSGFDGRRARRTRTRLAGPPRSTPVTSRPRAPPPRISDHGSRRQPASASVRAVARSPYRPWARSIATASAKRPRSGATRLTPTTSPSRVDERAAGAAGPRAGGVHDEPGQARVGGVQARAAPHRRDPPRRRAQGAAADVARADERAGIAEREDAVAGLQVGRGAGLRRARAAGQPGQAHERQAVARRARDERRLPRAAAPEPRADPLGARDEPVRRQDQPAPRVDDDSAARARRRRRRRPRGQRADDRRRLHDELDGRAPAVVDDRAGVVAVPAARQQPGRDERDGDRDRDKPRSGPIGDLGEPAATASGRPGARVDRAGRRRHERRVDQHRVRRARTRGRAASPRRRRRGPSPRGGPRRPARASPPTRSARR